MFGGISGLGSDHVAYATQDGSVLVLDIETGRLTAQFSVFPSGPSRSSLSACAADTDGTILVADALHRCVRRFRRDGRMTGRYGGRPTPGLRGEDHPGTLTEPGALLALAEGFVVASGGAGLEHAVQRFDAAGAYLGSLRHPDGVWHGANGLASVENLIWVAETEAGRLHRYAPDGRYDGEVDLHDELRQPFRIRDDGYEGVLLLLAPETREEQEIFGVARIDRSGDFAGWAVPPGEDPGRAYCAFDLAVLDDGRFLVADLPLGSPPDVRLQLFAADGRLLRVLLEDRIDLEAVQRDWFDAILAREGGGAFTLYEKARVHHHYSGGGAEHLREAGRLYRAALDGDPHLLQAHLEYGALLQRLGEPAAAEEEYRAAIREGGEEGELLARIARCRHDRGDLDAAVRILQAAVEGPNPPEDYQARLDDLGTYFLERAGETPERMI